MNEKCTLQVGERVTTYQLSGVYDTYILLSNTKLLDDGSTEGTIEYIGKEQNEEMLKVFNNCIERYGRRPMIYAQANLPDGVYSL